MGWTPTSVWSLNKNGGLLELIDDSSELRWTDGRKGPSGDIIPLSTFNPYITEAMVKIWSMPGDLILDPFTNRGNICFVAREFGRNCISYEIVKNYWEWVCKKKKEIEENPRWNTKDATYDPYLGDARKMVHTKDETVDCILTSPPFWSVENYESTDGQMNDAETYVDFLYMLEAAIKECTRVAKPGCWSVWESNFIRDKGAFIPFMDDIKRIHKKYGWILHDEIIEVLWSYSSSGLTAILQAGHTPKSHAYLDVWYKPPMRKITSEITCGTVIERPSYDGIFGQ